MLGNIYKKSTGERMKNTLYLLKHSFTIIGKDKDIIKPTIHMALLSAIMITLVVLALVGIVSSGFVLIGILMLLFTIFILLPFRFFYDTRQKASQSWIVYNVIVGKDISYGDAKSHIKLVKSTLRKIALIDILIAYVSSQQSGENTGVKSMIMIYS